MNQMFFGTLISCFLHLSHEGSEPKKERQGESGHEVTLRSMRLISRKFIIRQCGQLVQGTLQVCEVTGV